LSDQAAATILSWRRQADMPEDLAGVLKKPLQHVGDTSYTHDLPFFSSHFHRQIKWRRFVTPGTLRLVADSSYTNPVPTEHRQLSIGGALCCDERP